VYGGVGVAADLVRHAGAGLVIEPDSVDQLVEALKSMRGAAIRRRCGAAGRKFVRERYSVEQLVPRMASIVLGQSMHPAA
jgi:glycosyltransferase involved in cell wall biosynthesis